VCSYLQTIDSARATSDIVGKFEGRVIHRNPTESDITAMYGIFRSAHPDAEIFKAIDEVAYKIGLLLRNSLLNVLSSNIFHRRQLPNSLNP
jgi:hypothetical protein